MTYKQSHDVEKVNHIMDIRVVTWHTESLALFPGAEKVEEKELFLLLPPHLGTRLTGGYTGSQYSHRPLLCKWIPFMQLMRRAVPGVRRMAPHPNLTYCKSCSLPTYRQNSGLPFPTLLSFVCPSESTNGTNSTVIKVAELRRVMYGLKKNQGWKSFCVIFSVNNHAQVW